MAENECNGPRDCIGTASRACDHCGVVDESSVATAAARDRLLIEDDSEIEVVDDEARAVWGKPEREVVYTREDYERDKKARVQRGS